jgi:hypothetical protein
VSQCGIAERLTKHFTGRLASSMRVAIISDLHANLEALQAILNDYDELRVLTDLVNYGRIPIR